MSTQASPIADVNTNNNLGSSASLWKETKTPEGRIYWYNTSTRQSTWKKPEVLWTEQEKVVNACPWKEYTTPEGKKYYSHKETKETTWQIPQAYQDLLDSLKRIQETTNASTPGSATPTQSTPTTPAAIASPVAPVPASLAKPAPYTPSPPIYKSTPTTSASLLLSQPPDIKVDSPEKAMEQFHLLLKSKGVTPDWNWEETMRAIITDPRYRVFKTTGERKAAFQSFISLEAKRIREEREQKEQKERNDFYAMLDAIPQVKPYSSYRTVLPLLASQPAFQQINSERHRQSLFQDYIHQIQKSEKDHQRKVKKATMKKFKTEVLDPLEIKSYTDVPLWKDIYQQRVLGDATEGVTPLDYLEAFQDYHADVWEKPLTEYRQRMEKQQRHDRLARDGFKQLLKALHQENAINALTQWKEIYPRIANETRYTDLLGVPSSTPLDLFWDFVDDLDQDLYDQRKKVQDHLKQHSEKITLETSLEDYRKILENHPTLLNQLDPNNIPLIYQEIQKKEMRRQQELDRKQQRKTQKRIKALRHTLRKLDNPPLQLDDTWEKIEPRVLNHATYLELEQDEQSKREAFRQALAKLEESKQQGHPMDEDDDDDNDMDDDEEGMIKD